ncbi:MAG: chromosome segregation protein SMC, partial [Alphaproteobacteria bacterium]
PEAPDPLKRRLQTVALWKGEEDAGILRTRQQELAPGQKIVTSSGVLLSAEGITGRPSESAEEARLLAARNRQRALEKAVKEAGEKEAEQAARLQAAHEREEQARRKLAALQDQRRASQSRQETLAAALRQAEREVAAAEARLAAERSRLAALGEEREQLTARLAELEREHAALTDTAAGEAALRRAEEAVAKARERFETADGRVRMLLREAEDLVARRDALAREETAWCERRDNATRRLQNLEKRAAELAGQEAAIARRPQEIATRLEELDALLDEAERGARQADDRVAEAENARREAQGLLKTAQEAMAAAREERARAEADAEHAAQRLAEVVHEIEERFSLTAAAFKERMTGREEELPDDITELEAELAAARTARERLGAVNLRAEIEMKELAEQQDHLVHEKADLEAAIQRLRQGIGNLNREGRVRLLEAFETVNRHFADLFARLFEGGHARLELVESDDPLEAGLEIMARPPGKRLQSLSLLSGGEQTLTALALVFAVFLTNP